MQSIEIRINNQLADIDLNKVPLSLTRKIDLWDEFLGSEGTQAKSLNDTLYLPATKNNANILTAFDNYNADSSVTQNLLDVQLSINGIPTFKGYGQRVSASKIGVQGDAFAIKILGDTAAVFAKIDGLSLRDLSMGDAPTTPADINASWTPLSITTNPLIFAPAFYGKSTFNQAFVTFDNGTYLRGLRPCVRIWNILEAIFEKQLGYKIVSNIYQTEAFRNLVYPFGVGDLWERSDDVSATNCYVGALAQSYLHPAAAIKFLKESAPYQDAAGLNNFGQFNPAPYGAGWYVFTFNISTNNNVDRVVLRGNNPFAGGTNINLGEYSPNQLIVTEPILFEPSFGIATLNITVEGSASPLNIAADSYYKAELVQRFAYGQPLRIASCLHDRSQKDFLRGLQHAFGLVFAIDNINKEIRIDPRFFNATTPFVVPEGITNVNQSYYSVNADSEDLQVDIESTSVQHKRPFGDFIKLGYGEDSSDPLYSYIIEQANYNYDIAPLLGARENFIPADKKGTELRNPFFTYLLNIKTVPSLSIPRETVMPCMVDDIADVNTFEIANTFIKPSFECAPKLAMYYGVLDFNSSAYGNYYQFGFADYVTLASNQAINTIPSFFQVFPDSLGYWTAFDDKPYNLCYSSLIYENSPVPDTYLLGLIDRYHSKYLSIIYNDKWYSLTAKVNLSKYRNDFFQAPKVFNIGGQLIKGWQVSTESFNPTQSDKAEIIVIADYDNIKSDTYSEERGSTIPLIITGYIFELTFTGG